MAGDAAAEAAEAKQSTPSAAAAAAEKTQPQPPPLSGGDLDSVGDPCVLGVLTVSDRASWGAYEDLGGPAILRFFEEAMKSK